jgi:hypothetical protein
MALLDPVTGALGGFAVFLVVLGGLVIFVETVRTARVFLAVVADLAAAALLALIGELGLGLVVLGLGAAVLADLVFDWLTTR